MSRGIRSSARNPANAAAMTAINSEIGRRSAKDTRFIVPLRPVAGRGRPNAPGHPNENYRDAWPRCGSDLRPYAQPARSEDLDREQNLDGEPSWMAGSLRAPTINDIIWQGHAASGQTDAA